MGLIANTLTVAIISTLARATVAQVTCQGVLDNPGVIESDVFVEGGFCTIRNVNITGSVFVSEGGMLLTSGKVLISGSLTASMSKDITLRGRLQVNGGVFVSDSDATIIVGANANVGTVDIHGGATLIARGTMSSVNAIRSGKVKISGGRITGGGVFREGGDGDLVICGATVRGGISLKEMNGNLEAVSRANCEPSILLGAVIVEKGNGNVRIIGNTLSSGDLIVVEQEGNIVVRNATLSDLNLNRVKGNIVLDQVTADSDASITETTGTVMMSRSKLDGDFSLSENGAVEITNNNFGLEFVKIENSGSVTVTGNSDFSISLIENEGVTFRNNNARFAEISKNFDGVTISENTLGSISCSDNVPAPSGNGNMITGPATGQCASLQ